VSRLSSAEDPKKSGSLLLDLIGRILDHQAIVTFMFAKISIESCGWRKPPQLLDPLLTSSFALGTVGGHIRYPASGRRNGRRPTATEEEREMRKLMLIGAALTVGALGLNQGLAEQQQGSEQAAEEDMKVTGMVTEADQETKEISIEDQKFIMPEEGGGASVFPQVGAEVTVFYREEDQPVRDYGDRRGLPRPPEDMRGAARDAPVPQDLRTPAALRPYQSG
jgi:hypothetical protein